ncbi:MAG TPA: hypothetical protein VJ735_20365, partial [Actinomycetes bacterium]|nr:hypothetical protein [Actinomycetes bacterium]
PPVDQTPSARPPVARPAPRPVRPPHRPGHKPHPRAHHRERAPSAHRPGKPRTVGPEAKPSDGSPCPGPGHNEAPGDRRHHPRDRDGRRWVGDPADADVAEPRADNRWRDEDQPDGRSRDQDGRDGSSPSQERQDRDGKDEPRPGRHERHDRDPHEQRSAPDERRDRDQRGTDR